VKLEERYADSVDALDTSVCDRARLARDARFDGRFFIAVLSTGIYCRPICPSPTARRENVRYYRSAEEASAAGFRPCLRCRPETAPGTPAWNGTSATVNRALRLIAERLPQEVLGVARARLRRRGIWPDSWPFLARGRLDRLRDEPFLAHASQHRVAAPHGPVEVRPWRQRRWSADQSRDER